MHLGDYPSGAVLSLLFMPGNTLDSKVLGAIKDSLPAMFELGAPQDTSMLAAYASCVGASCSYCTMHTYAVCTTVLVSLTTGLNLVASF